MSTALVAIEVLRDSACSAVVTVWNGARRGERVIVIQGDTLDLELQDGQHVVVGPTPLLEDLADELAAEDAAAAMERA